MTSESGIQQPNVQGFSENWSLTLLDRIGDSKQIKLGKWMDVKGQLADSQLRNLNKSFRDDDSREAYIVSILVVCKKHYSFSFGIVMATIS